MQPMCIFCEGSGICERAEAENDHAYLCWDKNPVSPGHMLVIPKQHVESYFDLTEQQNLAMLELLHKSKSMIDEKYSPDAYNIGINDGIEAGRTVHHVHIHIIPRHKGDVENPRGGVRHIIPGKGDYPH